jgi:hypothetical protein
LNKVHQHEHVIPLCNNDETILLKHVSKTAGHMIVQNLLAKEHNTKLYTCKNNLPNISTLHVPRWGKLWNERENVVIIKSVRSGYLPKLKCKQGQSTFIIEAQMSSPSMHSTLCFSEYSLILLGGGLPREPTCLEVRTVSLQVMKNISPISISH